MDINLRDISFGAGCIPRVAKCDDNEAVDGLEAGEDALYGATGLQGLFEDIGGGGFWNVLEEDEARGCGLRRGVEVEREVRVRWGGGSMGGGEGGGWGERRGDQRRVVGSKWGGRLWGVLVGCEIEGTEVRAETRDWVEVGERHGCCPDPKGEPTSLIYTSAKILAVMSVPNANQMQSKWRVVPERSFVILPSLPPSIHPSFRVLDPLSSTDRRSTRRETCEGAATEIEGGDGKPVIERGTAFAVHGIKIRSRFLSFCLQMGFVQGEGWGGDDFHLERGPSAVSIPSVCFWSPSPHLELELGRPQILNRATLLLSTGDLSLSPSSVSAGRLSLSPPSPTPGSQSRRLAEPHRTSVSRHHSYSCPLNPRPLNPSRRTSVNVKRGGPPWEGWERHSAAGGSPEGARMRRT